MMDAPVFAGAGFGGKRFFVEEPKDLKRAREEAMNFKRPALVNCLLSQGSAPKPRQFRWQSLSDKSEHGAGSLAHRSGPVSP
jgi:thiamine pyrophosphate-dependent acetolactate synthase large subunit-like protein